MKENDYTKKHYSFSLENIPRRFLKKCKFCGYKRRSCFLRPSPCKALDKTCFKCGIEGHFPKSKKCNGRKLEFCRIIQVDGADDKSDQICKPEDMIKQIFAANCEIEEVSIVANYLRKFIHVWRPSKDHEL